MKVMKQKRHHGLRFRRFSAPNLYGAEGRMKEFVESFHFNEH
jgi:hypothetical protein